MGDPIQGKSGVAFNPPDVKSVGLEKAAQEIKDIAKKGPTGKFDTPEEYYEAVKALDRLLHGAIQNGYKAMATSGPAVSEKSVIVREKETEEVYEYEREQDGTVIRKNMLTGEQKTMFFQRTTLKSFQVATNGEQVFFLINNLSDSRRKVVVTYMWCTERQNMSSAIARVDMDPGLESVDKLVVEDGVVKAVIKDTKTGSERKEPVQEGNGGYLE